jgi:DNA-binding CsgD family transcriptional regulator
MYQIKEIEHANETVITDDRLDRIVSGVYECLTHEGPVQRLLSFLAEEFSAEMVALVQSSSDGENLGNIFLSSRCCMGNVRYYSDNVIPLGVTKVDVAGKRREVDSCFGIDKLFLDSVGYHNAFSVEVFQTVKMNAVLKVSRGVKRKRISRAEKELIRQLVPHINNFVRILSRLERISVEREIYSSAVDKLALAALILGKDGRIISANDTAKKLISIEPAICVVDGALVIEAPPVQKKYQEIVSRLLLSRQRGGSVEVDAMRIPREENFNDLGVMFRSVPIKNRIDGRNTPALVVFVSDSELRMDAHQVLVKKLFGFTKMEAQVAMLLADGLSIHEIADVLGSRLNTIRTHLRSIYIKTGVNRQALVVRLILKSVANLA